MEKLFKIHDIIFEILRQKGCGNESKEPQKDQSSSSKLV